MGGNPRENVKDKGFWEGGPAGHGANDQSGGRSSGYPGERVPTRTGVRTDLEFPLSGEAEQNDPK